METLFITEVCCQRSLNHGSFKKVDFTIDKAEFDKLPYREKLHFLMLEAEKACDIYVMLLIQDKIKECERESSVA